MQVEEDDMGTTILGDITNPAPVIIQPPQSNIGTIMGLIATIAAAGLGGYMYANNGKEPQTQQPQHLSYEGYKVGLGKAEDYEP